MLRGLKQFSLPEIEEKTLKFWRENQIFDKSLSFRQIKGKKKSKKFVFYEGPPTANGRPGIHHILARSFKDIILRYKTMAGFYVPRKGGWDTHGLPVELEVEKLLGLRSKKEIEKFGIAEFNRMCKESVWKYKDDWEKLTERIGFWLDLKNPYVTYENYYIEKLWGIIKEISKKKLLYKGHKIVPWCTRCGTALSSHELALGYKETIDKSVYVKFKLKPGQKIGNFKTDKNTYILSWTTTPWTLPGNVALAIGEKVSYRAFNDRKNNEIYILASELAHKVLGEGFEKTKDIKFADLIGLEYEPLFKIPSLKSSKSYKVYPADFVTTTDGTGVVHTAVMYGEDDYNLGKKVGLPQHHTVSEDGRFSSEVSGLSGMYSKSKETEEKIIRLLGKNNNILKTEEYKHDYPFCWRCGTPLLYYARDSWFVAISKLKNKLVSGNKKINWTPAHIKNGRFGEWLKEIKDWNFSRERYWGTPLPVWECGGCKKQEVVGSREELCEKSGGAKNRYFVLRHGQSAHNIKNILNGDPKNKDKFSLTVLGKMSLEKVISKIKKEKIDLVFSSDFRRTKETSAIIAKEAGFKKINFDPRLREINIGKELEGLSNREYHAQFPTYKDKLEKAPQGGGESLRDLGKRMWGFISEIESKNKGKNILIISHEYSIWLLESVSSAWSEEEMIREKEKRKGDFIDTAEFKEIDFWSLPRNEFGFGDLHRPYVDNFKLNCSECSKKMTRIKEVVDVWFDSGAMPFAQSLNWRADKAGAPEEGFPADYISEAVDQTRGWFYTLLATSTLLNKGAPYKNVICLGHVLDKNGQKMSKSKGNVVDPWQMISKYGTDAIRWYFYTVNPPGEPKRFDEADLGKILRQFIQLVYNSFVFYETYAKKDLKPKDSGLKSKNILDRWILMRLNETINQATKNLNKYEVGGAAKAIENFSYDLSRWYIRRSRRRLQKPENEKDYQSASQVLGFTLLELSKLLAPFMPFFAESVYRSLSNKELSVHLEDWSRPVFKTDKKLLENMGEVRRIAGIVLAKRAELGIKVRQPLGLLKAKGDKLRKEKELLEILKDEVNVKEISFDKKFKFPGNEEVWLDTNITHELKEEGWLRDFVRMVQDLRQDGGLEPKNTIILDVDSPEELNYVFQKNENTLKKEINAKSIEYRRSDKFEVVFEGKIENFPIRISFRKIK